LQVLPLGDNIDGIMPDVIESLNMYIERGGIICY